MPHFIKTFLAMYKDRARKLRIQELNEKIEFCTQMRAAFKTQALKAQAERDALI